MTKVIEKKLYEIAEKIESGYVEVGFKENARHALTNIPYATIAFWNEYGTRKEGESGAIPPRPFFRTMIANESPKWSDKIAKGLEFTNFDSEKTLGLLGEDVRGALVESIKNWTTPENAKYTQEKKGFNKPLVETGDMMKAVTATTHKGEMSD